MEGETALSQIDEHWCPANAHDRPVTNRIVEAHTTQISAKVGRVEIQRVSGEVSLGARSIVPTRRMD
jgi:hypothetical protein